MFNRNIKKSILFLFFAFLFSWGIYAFICFGGQSWAKNLVVKNSALVVYMFGPLLSAFIVQKVIFREDFIKPMGYSIKFNGWFILAFVIPVIIALGSLYASLIFNNVYYTPDMSGLIERTQGTISSYQFRRLKELVVISSIHPLWRELLKVLIAGCSVFAFVAFGSESGWRGLLHKEIGYFGFWKSSLLIGLIWGIWNIPLTLIQNYHPQHPKEGILMMIGFYILLSPILGFLRVRAKSVLATSIACGIIYFCKVLNVDVFLIGGGNDLIIGITGFSGLIVLTILNIFLFVYNNLILKMQYRVL